MARITTHAWILAACTAAAATSHEAKADPTSGSDHAIVLGDPLLDSQGFLTRTVTEANATFDQRATRLMHFAACRPQIQNPGSGDYKGCLNWDFNNGTEGGGLQGWGQDCLWKIAYTGPCGSESMSTRYSNVDKALATLAITDANQNGSSIDVLRSGELDTGIKDLIPILYLYSGRLSSDAVSNLATQIFNATGGDNPWPGNYDSRPPAGMFNPPFVEVNFDPLDLTSAFFAESENHTLLELSNQYLINQYYNTHPPLQTVDNSSVQEYLRFMLHGAMTTDFFEYNANPYQYYALYAMMNLADFAEDEDIALTARMVLDYEAAKFATSSSLLRRESPFRRRDDHDGTVLVGGNADVQNCRFLLYSGMLDTLATPANGGTVYAADTGCAGAVREAISTYRVPDTVLDLVYPHSNPYLQTFSGLNGYFPTLYLSSPGGQNVRKSPEIYDHEKSFLISAGGIPEPNGLPGIFPDTDLFFLPFFFPFGFVAGGSATDGALVFYSTGGSDVGTSHPTLLIPNDPGDSPTPVLDRTQMVRIEGVETRSEPSGDPDPVDPNNLCVAPGFACGAEPTLPTGVVGITNISSDAEPDGGATPWQFAEVASSPTNTFVAMLSATPTAPAGVQWPAGFFEAESADLYGNQIATFENKVRSNNAAGLGAILKEVDVTTIVAPSRSGGCNPGCVPQNADAGPTLGCSCTSLDHWTGHFVMASGVAYDFTIPAGASTDYPVASLQVTLRPTDTTTWQDLNDGPVQSLNGNNTTSIIDPTTGGICTLDVQNPSQPQRIGCQTTCSPTCTDGFACNTGGDCVSGICTSGICQAPSCSPTCGATATCGSNLDCASLLCKNGKCAAPGSDGTVCASPSDCGSQVCNGDGTCDPPSCQGNCQRGAPCGGAADCASNMCSTTCQPSACSPNCTDTQRCGDSSDCQSHVCDPNAHVCLAPSCAPHCQRGAPCGATSDCGSQVCVQGICGAPSCSPNCTNTQTCGDNSDCASRVCNPTTNKCVAPACSPTCQTGANCGGNSDCASQSCKNGQCAAPSCSPHCGHNQPCANNGDCSSSSCVNFVCK